MSSILLALALLQAAAAPPDCGYDRAAMLALDQQAFDQGPDGWRALAMRGCDRQAADLIRDWRTGHPDVAPPAPGILFWHEGQLRANAGDADAAVALFDAARKTPEEDNGFGWNLYVDGSIAFLRRDRAALEVARARLAARPRPKGFAPRGPDGKPLRIAWPLNLNVLDGFLGCWDRPYKIAYACAVPMRRVKE